MSQRGATPPPPPMGYSPKWGGEPINMGGEPQGEPKFSIFSWLLRRMGVGEPKISKFLCEKLSKYLYLLLEVPKIFFALRAKSYQNYLYSPLELLTIFFALRENFYEYFKGKLFVLSFSRKVRRFFDITNVNYNVLRAKREKFLMYFKGKSEFQHLPARSAIFLLFLGILRVH